MARSLPIWDNFWKKIIKGFLLCPAFVVYFFIKRRDLILFFCKGFISDWWGIYFCLIDFTFWTYFTLIYYNCITINIVWLIIRFCSHSGSDLCIFIIIFTLPAITRDFVSMSNCWGLITGKCKIFQLLVFLSVLEQHTIKVKPNSRVSRIFDSRKCLKWICMLVVIAGCVYRSYIVTPHLGNVSMGFETKSFLSVRIWAEDSPSSPKLSEVCHSCLAYYHYF